jgi:hypothetical protein
MRSIQKIALVVGLMVSDTAFAAQKNVVMEYEEPNAKQTKMLQSVISALPDACTFISANSLDLRQNKQTVGLKFNKSLLGDGVNSWLDAAFKQNLPYQPKKQSKINVTIVPKLHRLYSYPESMNILGVTALELDYIVDNKVALSRHYRGFYAKTNIAGGDGEFFTTLNYSLNDSIPKIVNDLSDVCINLQSSMQKHTS